MEKEEFFQKRMLELSKKAFFRGILTFSDFLDLNQQNILHSLLPGLENTGVRVRMFGGYETAERQMAAFVPDAFCYEEDFETEGAYPISCIQIAPLQAKFADALTHRDYLGSILNLGAGQKQNRRYSSGRALCFMCFATLRCVSLPKKSAGLNIHLSWQKKFLKRKLCQSPGGRSFPVQWHPQGLTVLLPWLSILPEAV